MKGNTIEPAAKLATKRLDTEENENEFESNRFSPRMTDKDEDRKSLNPIPEQKDPPDLIYSLSENDEKLPKVMHGLLRKMVEAVLTGKDDQCSGALKEIGQLIPE